MIIIFPLKSDCRQNSHNAPISLLRLLTSRCRLDFGKHACDLINTLSDEQQGNDNPEEVAEEVVSPEVESLRSAVDNVVDDLLESTDGIVENITIQLAQADDDLEGVAQRVVGDDEVGAEKGHGTPENSSDSFHADSEGILCHVTRIREGILLPELAKEVCSASHVEGIVGEIACIHVNIRPH